MKKRVTLKDIGNECGVTPTLVSAVLNNRLGRISCSEKKAELIRRTAERMGYHPDILARSMVKRQIPVVALMFHLQVDAQPYDDRYFSNTAFSVIMALREKGLETLIVFYRDEAEQIARFSELLRKGLICGVISNIIPHSHTAFTEKIKESGIPYVLLGKPDIPAVSVCQVTNDSFVGAFHRRYGTKKCFFMQMFDNKFVLYPHTDIQNYNRFDYKPLPATEETVSDPEVLTVILGVDYYLKSDFHYSHPVITEFEQYKYMIPEGVPHVLFKNLSGKREAMAAELFSQWLNEGKIEEKTYIV